MNCYLEWLQSVFLSKIKKGAVQDEGLDKKSLVQQGCCTHKKQDSQLVLPQPPFFYAIFFAFAFTKTKHLSHPKEKASYKQSNYNSVYMYISIGWIAGGVGGTLV